MNIRIYALILLSTVLLIADQLTKRYAIAHYQTETVSIAPFLAFSTQLNTGVAFSLFHSPNLWVFWGMSTLIGIIIAYFMYHAFVHCQRMGTLPWGSALVITGAVGNIIDRLRYGGVIDFIMLHYQDYVWPIFNLADIFICIGLLLILLKKEFA